MIEDDNNPLLQALLQKRVKAEVVDTDHYRIRGGMAVETSYIIHVESTQSSKDALPEFESFTLSKTYSSFRTLAQQLKKAADAATNTRKSLPPSVQKLAQYCETVLHLVEAQRAQYLGKVNYNYVQVLAKKRTHIINEVLEATLSYFPSELSSDPFHLKVANTVETFFLLDHCIEESDGGSLGTAGTRFSESSYVTPKRSFNPVGAVAEPLGMVGHAVESAVENVKENVGTFFKQQLGDKSAAPKGPPPAIDTVLKSPVVPFTRHYRRSVINRDKDEEELKEIGEEANLLLDDERPPTELLPSYTHPVPTFASPGSKLGDLLETNPLIFSLIFLVTAVFLKYAADISVTMDLDIFLLLIWAGFCIGLHTPRPMVGGIDKSAVPPSALAAQQGGDQLLQNRDTQGRQLMRRTLATTPDASKMTASFNDLTTAFDEDTEVDEIVQVGQSPMAMFPTGAPLGSKLNCWSEPFAENFQVRGGNYLSDKVKEASGPFVFPVRAIDLFLTDTCPENVGSNAGVLGGALREKPTFIINFRLPWGVLLCYHEIPERFVDFIRAGHEEGFDKSTLPSLDGMTNSDRCVARFCQDPQSEKNKKLKIVPVVVEGPWVVKSVVGGKPAIIGNKLPVNYHYTPQEGDKAMYLEADLDIVSSSAARGILSVTRTYTQVLTIDLGFVVQGNSPDELPEQMLVGTRLHGIDPLTAPPYPLSSKELMSSIKEGQHVADE
eukprot:Nitzschia sp. Nitz4//scaffold53_size117307//9759//12068//NITZ4_003753-RA/size117307-augustus-gene-0.90-mRNA-1//1//CDS//3329554154//6825//frame0